jgi:multiple sugar transport system permease protein
LGRGSRPSPRALAIIISILPVLVLFIFSQRALVSGMLAGATKG